MSKVLIFYDADDKDEVKWVVDVDKKLGGHDKLILVNGSLLTEEKRFLKPIYFDQGGKLVNHFGIQHVPAAISQEDRSLRITEVKP